MSQLPARTAVSDTYPRPSNATARTGFGAIWDALHEVIEAGEVYVASATTVDIGNQESTRLYITGTTTITSLGTTYRSPILLRFAGSLILVHNPTTLRCLGGASIVTAAGDVFIAWPTAASSSGAADGWQVARIGFGGGASSEFSAIKQAATTSATGVVELATDTEAQAGTDATRCVTPDNLGATVIGIGQTWQNLLASRAIGTTYTNSTGRPIQVSMAAEISSASAWLTMTVSGVTAALSSGTYAAGARAEITGVIIPSGGTYSVATSAGTATLQAWAELR